MSGSYSERLVTSREKNNEKHVRNPTAIPIILFVCKQRIEIFFNFEVHRALSELFDWNRGDRFVMNLEHSLQLGDHKSDRKTVLSISPQMQQSTTSLKLIQQLISQEENYKINSAKKLPARVDVINSYLCIRPKNASFSSEFEFCGRGATEASKQARTNGSFWQSCKYFRRPHYKAKNIIGKNTYKFVLNIYV
jgi:hypothetical protein